MTIQSQPSAVRERPEGRAQYLLRFDDLCPTMDRARWQRFLPLLARYRIEPILAIVPDNRDPELEQVSRDPDFWEHMRRLQSDGATVGLHGYQHLCHENGHSLVDLHRNTEFAGAPADLQRSWIRKGLAILEEHKLTPRVWVAPRHGFDRATIDILRDEGIGIISDGLASVPYRRAGLVWLPQQLWGPVVKKAGLWTIAYHSNTATDEEVQQLDRFLDRFRERFTTVDRVLSEWPIAGFTLSDRFDHTRALLRIRLSRMRRRVFPT